jgi:cholesterol transport system auxiliary component
MNLAMTGSNRLRGIRQGAAAALLALTLSGCISLGGKAPKMLIGLTADQSPAAGALPSGPQADALVVLDPEAGRKLDVLRIPVQVDDARIAYLTDVTWVERPARLFRQLIAETIRSRGKRLVLEAGDEGVSAKTTLGGRLVDMGYDARSQSAVVRYDAIRSDGKGAIQVRRFEAEVPGVSATAESIAPALNRAANQVAKEVADWVG